MPNVKIDKERPIDPLGIKSLGRYIEGLQETLESADLAAAKTLVRALDRSHDEVLSAYDQLVQRYTLLKQSNKQLFEEMLWLRDQCDDFVLEREELLERLSAGKAP